MAIIDCEAIGKGPQPLPVFLGAVGKDVEGKAKVTQILPDSPAAKAGLAVGDVITGVGEKEIKGFDELLDVLRTKRDPRQVRAARRARRREEVAGGHAHRAAQRRRTARSRRRPRRRRSGRRGIRRVWLGVTGGERDGKVTLLSVLPEGPAAKAVLKENDVVTALDGKPVTTYEQVTDAIRDKDAGEKVALKITRGSETLDVTVTRRRPADPEGFGGGRGFGGAAASAGRQRGGISRRATPIWASKAKTARKAERS